MEGEFVLKNGKINFLSDDGVFGSLICDEDNTEYVFHISSVSGDIAVGNDVTFKCFYDVQSIQFVAFDVVLREPNMKLERK